MDASGVACRNGSGTGTQFIRGLAAKGVRQAIFEQLQAAQIVRIKIDAVSLDSTIIKVHSDGTGALKKTGHKRSADPEADGQLKFIWSPRMLELR